MLLWPLSRGSMVLPVERFDPSEIVELIRDNGVSALSGAPPMWAALLDLPGVPADAYSTITRAGSGASALPSRVFEGMRDVYGLEISEGYGLTETAPVVSSSQGVGARPGSVGVPLPGVEMRLVDVEGQDALLGDVGEVWIRGANVFAGYWRDEAATRRVITEDGWLKTGDLGVMSEDRHLSLVDRAKDLIIVSGFNVYPAEVEEILIEHDLVESCAVIGVPHPHSGEAVTAQVVLREGSAVEEDELVEFCRARIASYKCPTKIRFVDRLPVAESGKLVRRLLTSDDA
jgi:long-chain acyl-CoA synthetase